MWIFKLCYGLLLLGLAVFYILYIDSLALVILLTALMLPVFLKFCLLWLKGKSHAFLSCNADTCTVGKSIPVSLMIENACPLSFPKAIAVIRIRHVFSDKSEQIRLKFPVHGRNTTKLTFWINAECCGAVTISLEKIRVLDYFYLFHTNLKINLTKQQGQLELLVMPEKLTVTLQEQAEAVYAPESNQHATNRPGDDPSEIFNIREYHAGDAVSRIHWKLSSKSEENLFIREFGYPIEKRILLIAEYLPQAVTDDLQRMQQAQAILTLIYSVACEFAEYARQNPEICTSLVWYDGSQDQFISHELKTPQDLEQIFRALYHTLHCMTLKAQILRDALTGQAFSSVTMITNDPGEESLRILEQQVTANQKNLLILKSEHAKAFPELHSDQVTLQIISPEILQEETQDIPEIIL
ncbi:MAG: DUF58 domain-containing protein, partial [Oscillospiraceae bacterium]|nr:DUF58 domain-containing protein [Oscillospiraceae bacterium]